MTTSKPRPSAAPLGAAPSGAAPLGAHGLDKRLDQVTLAGVTPPRGLRRLSVPLRLEPLPPPPKPVMLVGPTAAPLQELEGTDATRRLERSPAVDAALQDAVAAAEATREVPAQRRAPVRPATVTGISPVPALVPKLAAMPELAQMRPPPLPPRKPLPPHVVPVQAPRAAAAPVPKILGVLGDDVTIPGMSPVSSGNGQVISHAELYRLQLEFEDTPARPLPALASLFPLPVFVAPVAAAAFVDAAERSVAEDGEQRLAGVYSTDLHRLEELEGIEDLDALAQAMGLKSMEVSIPDGLPLDEISLPPRSISLPTLRRRDSEVHRARVHAALGDGSESVFLDDTTIEGLPVARTSVPSRPPLPARATSPVIVRIPARPKVSPEARARARKLYLSAVDELTRGDRDGAIGHLKLAVHYDDAVPLYQDFLRQLTKPRNGETEITDSSRSRRRARVEPTIRG